MKTVFLINGKNIHHTTAGEGFAFLRDSIAAKGYRVVPVDITWRRKIPTQFATEFIELYQKEKGDYNIVLGNSFGAVVALITATKIRPDEIILCSLSPFFKEDFDTDWPTHGHIKRLGKRRIEDIASYSAKSLAKEVKGLNIKIKMMYGEQEIEKLPKLVKRVKETAVDLGIEASMATDAPHSFRDPAYAKAIATQL